MEVSPCTKKILFSSRFGRSHGVFLCNSGSSETGSKQSLNVFKRDVFLLKKTNMHIHYASAFLRFTQLA